LRETKLILTLVYFSGNPYKRISTKRITVNTLSIIFLSMFLLGICKGDFLYAYGSPSRSRHQYERSLGASGEFPRSQRTSRAPVPQRTYRGYEDSLDKKNQVATPFEELRLLVLESTAKAKGKKTKMPEHQDKDVSSGESEDDSR
jgi:hypothetical protein